jgi:chromosome segregation ATPase
MNASEVDDRRPRTTMATKLWVLVCLLLLASSLLGWRKYVVAEEEIAEGSRQYVSLTEALNHLKGRLEVTQEELAEVKTELTRARKENAELGAEKVQRDVVVLHLEEKEEKLTRQVADMETEKASYERRIQALVAEKGELVDTARRLGESYEAEAAKARRLELDNRKLERDLEASRFEKEALEEKLRTTTEENLRLRAEPLLKTTIDAPLGGRAELMGGGEP